MTIRLSNTNFNEACPLGPIDNQHSHLGEKLLSATMKAKFAEAYMSPGLEDLII